MSEELCPLTIMVVEDEIELRTFLVKYLKRHFISVISAQNGKEGIELYKETLPDVIITDISMPIMDGLDMIEGIKNEGYNPFIVIMSAHSEGDLLLNAIQLRVNNFLIKPIVPPKLLAILMEYYDILSAKQKMEQYTSLLTQYKNAMDESSIISKTDINGIITYVNDKFCQVLGYTKEELIGYNHNIIRHPETSASLFKNLWDTILEKKIWKGIVKNLNKARETRYFDTVIVPFTDAKGDIVEFIALRTDITELQMNNYELLEMVAAEVAKSRQQEFLLQQQSSQAAMGDMVNSIAHQWRQPLNAINVATLGIMTETELGGDLEKINQKAQSILTLAGTMSKVITDFMEFSRSNAAKENFKLHDSVDAVQVMLEPHLHKRRIQFINNIDVDYALYGYKHLLQQVLLNIVNNAVQAFKEDVITNFIRISMQTTSSLCTLIIEDNAGGVEDEVLAKIFEPYYTTKPKGIGTGLGLSISKNLIEGSWSGTINAHNSAEGFIVSITIPKELKDKN